MSVKIEVWDGLGYEVQKEVGRRKYESEWEGGLMDIEVESGMRVSVDGLLMILRT